MLQRTLEPPALPDLETTLRQLDDRATSGRWGQYHPKYMPEAVWHTGHPWDFDTSHDLSAVEDGTRYKLGHFRHARDAAFAEALVNAWRAGQLRVVDGTT